MPEDLRLFKDDSGSSDCIYYAFQAVKVKTDKPAAGPPIKKQATDKVMTEKKKVLKDKKRALKRL